MLITCGLSASDAHALGVSVGQTVTRGDDLVGVLPGCARPPTARCSSLAPGCRPAHVTPYAELARAARPEAVVVLLRPAANRLERHAALHAGIDAVLLSADLEVVGRDCRATSSPPGPSAATGR